LTYAKDGANVHTRPREDPAVDAVSAGHLQAGAPTTRTIAQRCTRRDPTKEGIVHSHSILIIIGVVAAMGAGPLAAQGNGPNAARNLSATCANCHGTNGVSQGVTDSLAGVPKDDLVRKMQDYKTGKRPGTIMPQLAKGYTDQQIELIAGWYAAQKAPK
jgi:cytochrome c553